VHNLLSDKSRTPIRIANEYFLKGEKEKAMVMYQALAKKIFRRAAHT
jgi:hypothetical protein